MQRSHLNDPLKPSDLSPPCDMAECRCFFLASSQPMRPTMTGEPLNARRAAIRRPWRSNTN